MSVALFEDKDERTGTIWHVTLESQEWGEEQLAEEGLVIVEHSFETADFVRGSGNGPTDWNRAIQTEMGFHIVAAVATLDDCPSVHEVNYEESAPGSVRLSDRSQYLD